MHTSHLSPELDTSFEMKSLLFLLALGYVSSDKLDLSYLPPPGSQYAGGRPGDIQIPLEFPKETYSTTFRPQLGDNRGLSPEDYKATIGIDRVPGVQDVGSVPFVPNTNRVPTTTVSYAFTQTTTHPPNEGFETTLSPLVNEGFPTTDLFNIPSQEPSLTYDGNLNLQKLPGYQQTVNQFGQPSLATTPATFNNIPSQLPGSTYGGNFNQFGQPTLTPTSVPVTQYTGSLNQRVPTGAQFVGQDQSGYKQSVFPNQFKNQSYIGGLGSVNQPGFVSSTVLPQGFPTTARPVTTIGNNIYNVPSILPNNVQKGIPEEGVQINGKPLGNQKLNEQPGLQQFLDRPTVSQTLPGSQILNQLNGPSTTAGPAFAPNAQQNVYQPSSTIAPTYSPGILNQDYPAGTAIIPGQSGQQFATVSPNPGTQANAISSVYRQRPERPQAEGDRNAVILNYENVITPEGFSYSFDTSNGIHADESGTATDGVKAKGSYSYVGDDGKLYSVVYTADENGFRPQGDHLPTPPPVPEAIQRVIDQAERDREAGISDDGSYNEDKYGHKKYQGTMNRRPSLTNGAVIPESDVTNTRVKQIKQKTRPQIGEQRPDMALDEAYYADNNQKFVDKNERRRPISASTKRPLSPITDINEEDIEGGDLEGVLGEDQTIYSQSTSGPYVDITSKRPVNQAVRKQYNNNISPDAAETYIKNEDRRRPNADVPSVSNENQNQDSVQYSEYKMPQNKGDNNYNFETKESSERPLDYENGEISETSKPFKQTEGQKVLDKFGRPVIKNPSRRPVSSADRFEKYPSTEEQYKNQQSNRRPSNKVTSSVIDNLQNQNDDYSSEEDSVPFSPTRLRPGNVKIPNKFVKQDQYATIGKRRRPARPGLQVYKDAEGNIQYQSEGDKDYEESEDTSDYNRGTPSGSFTDSYEEIDQETDGFNSNTGFVSGRPKNTFKKMQERPQGTKNIIKDERLQGSLDNQYKTNVPGKNGQKLAPPPYGKQSGLIDGDYGPNGSGYQYYPPQTKFEQDEVKTFLNGVTGSTRPLAERPTPSTNNYESKYEDVTRIFMTPNVPQTKVGINGDQFQASTPGAPNKFDVQNYFQYPVDGYTSEETFEDELTNGPINKVISSTKRPSQGTQKDKPLQGHDSRYVQSTKRPGFVSSTTPLPSSRPYTGTRPTSPYLDQRYTTGGEPGQTFVSSTTPLPSQSPIDDFSQQGTIKPQYRTTYGPPETFGPTSAYKNRTKIQRLPSAVQYQENLPSTTYRPSYTTYGPSRSSSATAPPNIQVDRYGRPISKPGFGSTSQEYLPGPTQTSSTMRPEQRVDVYGKPVQLEYGTTAQEYIPGDQNEPSSTALPEVLVDTFGRPIRPGQGVTNQELAATKPGSSADAFGRPIKPGQRQQFIPGGQIQPTTTAQPGLSIDAYGRPTPGSSSIDNTPGYTTPSGIIQSGDRLVGQYQPGVVPTVQDYIQGSVDEQIRPTSVTVSPGSQFRGNQRYPTGGLRNQPSVSQSVSTFQPSTERVVGEDFSGPKQQQRFDPERGYYY